MQSTSTCIQIVPRYSRYTRDSLAVNFNILKLLPEVLHHSSVVDACRYDRAACRALRFWLNVKTFSVDFKSQLCSSQQINNTPFCSCIVTYIVLWTCSMSLWRHSLSFTGPTRKQLAQRLLPKWLTDHPRCLSLFYRNHWLPQRSEF